MHEARVRRFLGRLLLGEGVDDLAQDVFLKAWRMAGSWREEGSYSAWLMRIAWTSFLSSRRARTRSIAREQVAFETMSAPTSEPDLFIDLKRALANLSERERTAALLCLGEGYSHVEAATIMALPLGTLKSNMVRAQMQLRTNLEAGND
jgi:RNA polymerase sigma-70 factor (ECF subfamily)